MKLGIALRALPLAALLVVGACQCRAPSNAPAPVAAADAGAHDLDDAGDVCSAACANLHRHGCDEALVSPLGESCAALCRRDQARGTAAMLHPELVADAATPEAMHAAGVRCVGWR